MKQKRLLAFDLGASSGRCVAGEFNGERLTTSLVGRFPNRPIWAGKHCYWDILFLWDQMQQMLLKAREFSSISVDTWGCDFVLLARDKTILQQLMCYRDPVLNQIKDQFDQQTNHEEIYRLVGSSYISSSTVLRLLYLLQVQPKMFELAETLLLLPDYLLYLLSGQIICEQTIASTTQLIDPRSKTWCEPLLQKLGIPAHIFLTPRQGPIHLGRLENGLAQRVNNTKAEVFATCGHDSAAACTAVPELYDEPFVCISTGSWAIFQYESERDFLDHPIAQRLGFMHEKSPGKKNRLVFNIVGLWMVQQICNQSGLSFEELEKQATAAKSVSNLLVPEQITSMSISNFIASANVYFTRTGKPTLQLPGEFLRCIYNSLALNFAKKLDELETIVNHPIEKIYMVGGGVNSDLFLHLTAAITKREVICGPVEAASVGNLLLQLEAIGELSGLTQVRQLAAASFPPRRIEPQRMPFLDEMRTQFDLLVQNNIPFPMKI